MLAALDEKDLRVLVLHRQDHEIHGDRWPGKRAGTILVEELLLLGVALAALRAGHEVPRTLPNPRAVQGEKNPAFGPGATRPWLARIADWLTIRKTARMALGVACDWTATH